MTSFSIFNNIEKSRKFYVKFKILLKILWNMLHFPYFQISCISKAAKGIIYEIKFNFGNVHGIMNTSGLLQSEALWLQVNFARDPNNS